MNQKKISSAVIHRLPKYYRHLGELVDSGIQRISSRDLSIRMRITASQIRHDLNQFGGFGQQGYGYNVGSLYKEIEKILGLGEKHNMVVIGAGNLGKALAHYQDFKARGFNIEGIFDNNEKIIGEKVSGLTVKSIDELPEFVREHHIEIGTIAIPKTEAKKMAKVLVDNGVRQIWNFAHTDLHMGDGVVVENVNLTESLMRLSFMAALDKKQ